MAKTRRKKMKAQPARMQLRSDDKKLRGLEQKVNDDTIGDELRIKPHHNNILVKRVVTKQLHQSEKKKKSGAKKLDTIQPIINQHCLKETSKVEERLKRLRPQSDMPSPPSTGSNYGNSVNDPLIESASDSRPRYQLSEPSYHQNPESNLREQNHKPSVSYSQPGPSGVRQHPVEPNMGDQQVLIHDNILPSASDSRPRYQLSEPSYHQNPESNLREQNHKPSVSYSQPGPSGVRQHPVEPNMGDQQVLIHDNILPSASDSRPRYQLSEPSYHQNPESNLREQNHKPSVSYSQPGPSGVRQHPVEPNMGDQQVLIHDNILPHGQSYQEPRRNSDIRNAFRYNAFNQPSNHSRPVYPMLSIATKADMISVRNCRPKWFDSFVEEFVNKKKWRMEMHKKMFEEIVSVENKKLSVLEKLIDRLN